jgi:hypothetical protein
MVLSRGHLAIEEVLHSRPGMIVLWVPYAVLVLRSGDVADNIPFCKHHLVPFRKVDSCINLEHVTDSTNENCKVFCLWLL